MTPIVLSKAESLLVLKAEQEAKALRRKALAVWNEALTAVLDDHGAEVADGAQVNVVWDEGTPRAFAIGQPPQASQDEEAA